MPRSYTTLDGEVLNLSELSAEETSFLERCLAAYRDGMGWLAFTNLIAGSENPLVRGAGGRVTRAIWQTPLWRAVRDLEDRVGLLRDDLVPEPGFGDLGEDPLADEWVPATQAAHEKGVTLPGLHKAIARGALVGAPLRSGGRRLVVSRRSLQRWQPDRARQRSRGGRAPAPAGGRATARAGRTFDTTA